MPHDEPVHITSCGLDTVAPEGSHGISRTAAFRLATLGRRIFSTSVKGRSKAGIELLIREEEGLFELQLYLRAPVCIFC